MEKIINLASASKKETLGYVNRLTREEFENSFGAILTSDKNFTLAKLDSLKNGNTTARIPLFTVSKMNSKGELKDTLVKMADLNSCIHAINGMIIENGSFFVLIEDGRFFKIKKCKFDTSYMELQTVEKKENSPKDYSFQFTSKQIEFLKSYNADIISMLKSKLAENGIKA